MQSLVSGAQRLALVVLLGGFLLPNANSQEPSSPVTLAQLRDRFRPLLLFAARPDDPALLAQMTRLKDAAPGLREREVLVISVPYKDPSAGGVSLGAADAQAARRSFHIAPGDFTAILLGKDGGEKFRSTKPVSFEVLRNKIDAMPMRRDEMKDRAGAPNL